MAKDEQCFPARARRYQQQSAMVPNFKTRLDRQPNQWQNRECDWSSELSRPILMSLTNHSLVIGFVYKWRLEASSRAGAPEKGERKCLFEWKNKSHSTWNWTATSCLVRIWCVMYFCSHIRYKTSQSQTFVLVNDDRTFIEPADSCCAFASPAIHTGMFDN